MCVVISGLIRDEGREGAISVVASGLKREREGRGLCVW